MTAPVGITLIAVTATYVLGDGTAACGSVTFTPTALGQVAGYMLPIAPLRVTLSSGGISTYLAATDDPEWSGPDFAYRVTERLRGGAATQYGIEVPYDSPDGVLDLALAPRVTLTDALPGYPTLADLRGTDPEREDPDDLGYLGANSWNDTQLQGALDTEISAQARVCRVAVPLQPELKEALMRRVACNLARRPFPLAMLRGDAEAGEATALPGRDPEVRRLEGPYRRLPIG